MHLSLKLFTNKILVSAVSTAVAILMSGLADTAIAMSSCNTADYEGFVLSPIDGKTTYAITKNVLTWQAAKDLAVANGARLAEIQSKDVNDALSSAMATKFTAAPAPSTGSKAWLGLFDPVGVRIFTPEGSAPITTPDRFSWASGAGVSFVNWQAGQPDNYCTEAEKALDPDHNCVGENSAAMNTDGGWSDEGTHSSAIQLKGLTEWPDSTLDCVRVVTPPTEPVVVPLPADNGATWCSDSLKMNLAQCVKTTENTDFCAQEKQPCAGVWEAPTCPSGSILNTTRDMCQKAPDQVKCGSGYTWDQTIDKCVMYPPCSDGGTYNSTTDRCEKLVQNDCPVGYSYDANQTSPTYDRCVKSVVCNDGGTFITGRDRCEKAWMPSCDTANGYAYNGATGKCERSPVCPSGMSYSGVYNVCVQAITPTCASGYAYNASRGRCEMLPVCPTGTTFNSVTNRCEVPATTITSYVQPITGKTEIIKYKARGDTSTGIDQYSTSPPSLDVVSFDFIVQNGQVVLKQECAWGGAGNCGCDSPHWDGYCWDKTTLSQARNGNTLTVTAKVTVSLGRGGIRMASAAASADLSEFATCPSGYTRTSAPSSSQCTTILTQWGNQTGITDCTQAGLYTCSAPKAACYAGYTLDGNACYQNPTCPGGSFDYGNHVCYVAYTPSCTQGTYDSASGLCVIAPTCSNGALDGGTDTCYQANSTGCPSGYSLSGSVCIATPSCTAPGSFTGGSVDLCRTTATYLCPSGYSYSGATGQCYQTANCNGGGLNTTSDKCEMAFVYTCPGGYATVGSICQAAPTCTTGGTYNSSFNLCASNTGACSAGILDTGRDVCYQAAGCANGTLNTTRDQCQATATPNCGTSSYDATNVTCYSPFICDLGAFQPLRDRCEATVSRNCGTYTWSAPDAKCLQPVTCPTDTTFSLNSTIQFSATLDRCVSDAEHVCSAGLTWIGLPIAECEAVPICPGAIYYDTVQHSCLMSAGCPFGNQYICMQNPNLLNASGQGGWQCSPNACVDTGPGGAASLDKIQDDSYLHDDGQRDDTGACLGQIYIFNGKRSRCRSPGWTVGYINDCCAGGDTMPEDTGSGALLGIAFKSLNTVYEAGKAAYAAYQGVQMAQAGYSATQIGIGTAATMTKSSAEAAQAAAAAMKEGASTTSSVATGVEAASAVKDAARGAAAAVVTYAVGAAVKGLGGDQDAVMVGQVAAMAAMQSSMIALISGPQAIIGIVIIVVMRVLMGSGCDINDITTTNFVKSKMCHLVGDYCEKKWALVGCVQKATGYCCFNSIMARIIHEQGRPQINLDWGDPANPNCRGFTPDEFQSLDFSRIDLSEYFSVIQKDMDTKIGAAQQGIATTLQNKFQQITGGTANP